ncbi:hypothetical protein [Salmonella enterica]
MVDRFFFPLTLGNQLALIVMLYTAMGVEAVAVSGRPVQVLLG